MGALRSLCEVPVPSVTHFVPCGGGKHAGQTAGELPARWVPCFSLEPPCCCCLHGGGGAPLHKHGHSRQTPTPQQQGLGFAVRTMVSEDAGDEAVIRADPALVLSVIWSCSDGLASRRGRCCLPEPSPSERPHLHQRRRPLRSSAQAWGPGPHPALPGFEGDRGLGTQPPPLVGLCDSVSSVPRTPVLGDWSHCCQQGTRVLWTSLQGSPRWPASARTLSCWPSQEPRCPHTGTSASSEQACVCTRGRECLVCLRKKPMCSW